MAKRGKAARAQLPIRIPEALRARIEKAAKSGGVSMNAEIVARIEASFAKEDAVGGREMLPWVQTMTGAFARGGQRGAQASQHPEWTTAEWLQDPLCYDAARYAVSYALEVAQPVWHESESKVDLQIHDIMARQIARGEIIKGVKK